MMNLISHRQIVAFNRPRARLALLLWLMFAFAQSASAQQTQSAKPKVYLSLPAECSETRRQLLDAQQLVRTQDFTIETLAGLLKIEKLKNVERPVSILEFDEMQRLRKQAETQRVELAKKDADLRDRDKFISLILKTKSKTRLEAILDWLLKH